MKIKLSRKKILLYATIGMIACYGLYLFLILSFSILRVSYFKNEDAYESNLTIGKRLKIAENSSIKISTINTNVKIIQASENDLNVDINVTQAHPKCQLNVDNQNGELRIEYAGEKRISFWGHFLGSDVNCEGVVTLSIPKNRNVNISTTSGDVTAENEFKSLSVDTVSADVKFVGTAQELNLFTVSGDMKADYTSARNAKNIHVNTVSGDAFIGLPEDTKIKYQFHSTSGKFYVDDDNVSENDASLSIQGKSVSGDMHVEED